MTEGKASRMSPIVLMAEEMDTDIFLFSGPIERPLAHAFVDCYKLAQDRPNCALILSTYGGDPDAGFIIARHLKQNYDIFRLYVFGTCKSAGTLIALGADEIIMSPHGELGPLDVQLIKDDEFMRLNSGVDIFQALSVINEQAFSSFERYFLQIIRRSGGFITTKTAADIATKLSTGLYSPITEQIDPYRLSEVQRAINIAMQYGARLGANPDTIRRLIFDYPSHGFVIDMEEAGELFPCVRPASHLEDSVVRFIRERLNAQIPEECILTPHPMGVIDCLTRKQEHQDENPHEEADCPSVLEGKPDSATDSEAIGGGGTHDRNGQSLPGGDDILRPIHRTSQSNETDETIS